MDRQQIAEICDCIQKFYEAVKQIVEDMFRMINSLREFFERIIKIKSKHEKKKTFPSNKTLVRSLQQIAFLNERGRVKHLAFYGRKARVRKKNYKRLLKQQLKE